MNSGTVGSAFPNLCDGVLDALLHLSCQITVDRHQCLLCLNLGHDGQQRLVRHTDELDKP